MNILLIKVSASSDFKNYKAYNGGPPQNIFSLAAATSDRHAVTLVDETIGQQADEKAAFDLVVLFASTPDVARAYELATTYRATGTTVVMGGLHVSFLPEEALGHVDSVLIGEAELVWSQLLQDLENGALRRQYQAAEDVEMGTLGPYPSALAAPYVENGVWSVLAARGCKFKCEYCAVHKFFPTFRTRPVGDVIDEIRKSGIKQLEIHADNLIADRDYAMELFSELKKLNIQWTGEATLNIAGYDDILEAAAESGLFYLVVGLETCSYEALKNAGKGFIHPSKAKEQIRKLHDYQIAVDSCMLFGFDEHTPDIFEETLEFVQDIELDVVHSTMLIPFAGTELFNRLDREGRILSYDWSDYDGSHCVFQPKNMGPQQLEEGVDWFHRRLYSVGSTMKRRYHQFKNLGWDGAYYLP